MSSESSEEELSAVEKYIDKATGNLVFSRRTPHNLEERTVAAAELYGEGYFKRLTEAADALGVPYQWLRGRCLGKKPVTDNGGNNKLLTNVQHDAILQWCHRQVVTGHHVDHRRLRLYVNEILDIGGIKDSKGKPLTVSQRWCRRYMNSNKDIFHRRKTSSRDVKRKAAEDRAAIEAWFDAWEKYIRKNNIKTYNIWNFDETGFMVGYLQGGIFIWTFIKVKEPIVTDPNDHYSITVTETINTEGQTISPFIILPGVNIPESWVQNDLEGQTIINTSERGYTNNMLTIEWFEHFERHTRPLDTNEKRVLLMDNHESHDTAPIHRICILGKIDIFPLPAGLTHLLQPADVGVFGPYKHWHEHVLSREVADGAHDFGKADFMFHLAEIRRRTFRSQTIKSAWKKSGIWPINRSEALDRLNDPISSFSANIDESELAGYVHAPKSANSVSPHPQRHTTPPDMTTQPDGSDEPFTPPTATAAETATPPTIRRFDWEAVNTPNEFSTPMYSD